MVSKWDQLTKDCLAAANAHDIEKFLSFYTDDCIYEDVAVGKVNRGKDELRAFYQQCFIMSPDVKFDETTAINSEDRIATEWVMSGTHTGSTPELRATGKKYSIRGMSIMEVRDDKLSKQSDYWNMASFLQQLGLLPTNTVPNWFGRFMMRLMMKH